MKLEPMTEKQIEEAIGKHYERIDGAMQIIAARDAQWVTLIDTWTIECVVAEPKPDCRTCENFFDRQRKNNRYGCEFLVTCTNGDQYKPAPKVVLWRTE